jgi:hypothetical protein
VNKLAHHTPEGDGGDAVFRIGTAAAKLQAAASLRHLKGPRRRSGCKKFCQQIFFGEDAAAVRQKSYREGVIGAEHAQSQMERKATREIEGVYEDGVSTFSEDHELAIATDDVLDSLVIKREAALDDLSLRM